MRTNILINTVRARFRSSQASGWSVPLAPAGITTARGVGMGICGIIGVCTSGSDDLTLCEMIAQHCPFVAVDCGHVPHTGGVYIGVRYMAAILRAGAAKTASGVQAILMPT